MEGGPEKEDEPGTWHQRFEMELHGNHLYLGTYDELVVVDVQDLHAMRELTRFGIESYQDYQLYNRPRFLAAAGDRLYVERFWPRELVEFDISNPAQPREVDYLIWSDRMQSLQVFDGMVLGRWWEGMKGWRIDESGVLVEVWTWEVPEKFKRGWSSIGVTVDNGYLYIVKGGSLLAFDWGEGL